MIHIGRDEAVALLHRVIEERGEDFVYDSPPRRRASMPGRVSHPVVSELHST